MTVKKTWEIIMCLLYVTNSVDLSYCSLCYDELYGYKLILEYFSFKYCNIQVHIFFTCICFCFQLCKEYGKK